MPIFISATGTDVGKTFLSALILARYGSELNLQYLKPVQTGNDSDRASVQNLSGLSDAYFQRELLSFPLAASPHFAAEQVRATIDTQRLTTRLAALKDSRTIIELAGGVMVPLSRDFTNLDLMRQIGFQTILVAATGLGTINHTLLSLHALKTAGVVCAGVFFVGADNLLFADNARTICEMGAVQNLGKFFLDGKKLTPEEFQFRAAAFDATGKILELLA